MGEPLGIGFLGCGGMAAHLSGVCSKMANAKIVAVYDLVEDRARELASRMNCRAEAKASVFRDRPDGGALTIATPSSTHSAYAVAALERGKHVFCEKPMALKVEDCDAMIGAAEKARLTLMVGHVMRFYSGCALAKRAVDEGELGRLLASSVSRTGWVEVGTWAGSWRRSKEDCQNSLFECTIHEIDLMRWFMGDVESVQAYGSNFAHPELDYDDCSIAVIKFKSGALGTLESGYAFRMGDHRIKVNGTEGAFNVDFGTSTVRFLAKGAPERAEPLVTEDPYAAELRHFVECVAGGKRPLTDGREGRKAVEIAEAINRSVETGGRVRIP
ncbi:MAG: Gfo/Idh/MocA family oxidoreductase [Thermoproteota archaeon]